MKGYSKTDEMKDDYETIIVPAEAKERIKKGIAQAKQAEKVKPVKKVTWGLRIGSSAAAAMLALILFANLNVSFAQAVSDIPVLGSLVQVVTFRTYENTEKDMSAKIVTPHVSVKDASGKKNITTTKKLNEDIDKYISQIKKQYEADVKETGGEGKETVTSDYKIVTDNAKLFSLELNTVVSLNTSGVTFKIYHIDKESGQLITLKDIFKENMEYCPAITNEIKRQMKQQMKQDNQKIYFIDDKDMPEDNWKGITDESNFYISKKGELTFVFDKYEVAPGYMGACKFAIPQSVIQDMVKTEYFK